MPDTCGVRHPHKPPILKEGTTLLDVSTEKCRCYHYPEGKKYQIDYPKEVYILPNGSHRVIDEEGIVHRPTPGWLAISWVPKIDAPAFVA